MKKFKKIFENNNLKFKNFKNSDHYKFLYNKCLNIGDGDLEDIYIYINGYNTVTYEPNIEIIEKRKSESLFYTNIFYKDYADSGDFNTIINTHFDGVDDIEIYSVVNSGGLDSFLNKFNLRFNIDKDVSFFEDVFNISNNNHITYIDTKKYVMGLYGINDGDIDLDDSDVYNYDNINIFPNIEYYYSVYFIKLEFDDSFISSNRLKYKEYSDKLNINFVVELNEYIKNIDNRINKNNNFKVFITVFENVINIMFVKL